MKTEPKTKTTKVFHQIPKQIRIAHAISNKWQNKTIEIHHPAYISVKEDEDLVWDSETESLRNSKVNVMFWTAHSNLMHITVY